MISKAQIEYILAVYTEENFKKAADKCFVTQPTLSMQIKKAEEIFGYPIFNRDTSPVRLTSFGKEVLPYLQEVEDTYVSLENFILKKEGKFDQEITLGVIPTIASYLVPILYKSWNEHFKDVQLKIIELTSEKLLDAISKKQVDAGIMAGPIELSNISDKLLFNEQIKLYAPSVKTKTVSKDELNQMQPWLLSKGNCLRTQMINFCELKTKSKSDWDYQGGNMQILIEMAKSENGYTLIPEFYGVSHPELNKELKEMEGKQPARSVVGFHLSRNSKADILSEVFKLIKKSFIQNNSKNLEILPWK